MRLKADILLFIVALIWGTGFVAQGVAALSAAGVKFGLAVLERAPRTKQYYSDTYYTLIFSPFGSNNGSF
ncbi:MAG TPA: hypothetical protein PKK96_02415 [Anaerolineales bacterium]|nr:hypothetical protein [Anaerolineales bacterium]HNQ94006.1 hypothetical protein [Anaerolineales bacterium]HNS59833.1 hypothetical protein [Anaerolineales bacterium]